MENVPTTSSFPGNRESGDRNVDDISTLMQHLNVTEPAQLFFGVCTTPLAELCRITVTQLRVNKRSRGYYLLLRTLEPPVTGKIKSGFGRNALVQVEDQDEIRIHFCLHAHVHLRSETELEELLPVNTIFALKQPLLMACSEQQLAVVVGSPSDFVVIGRSHVLSKEVEALGWKEKTEDERVELAWKWRQIGDSLLEEGKFYQASDAYLFALSNCIENYPKLVLNQNLAMCFFAQECYETAVKHALNVLEIEPLNERALYSAGRAHYELGEYTKATFYFEILNCVSPANADYLSQLIRCQDRLIEAEGIVDIYNLYQSSLTDVTAPIEHGNFRRNVEFRPGPGNLRGVFATQDMEPGTLILVEKAVVTIFEPSCSSERGTDNFMHTAVRAVLRNPKTLGQKLFYLPGGCSSTDENRSMFCDKVNELEPIVDVGQLYQILYKNMLTSTTGMIGNAALMCHVYESASRFRHFCLANCSFHAYKDVIVVQTCGSVMKGEELFLRFYENSLSFHEKQRALERSGFTCSCFLCALDKMELTENHDLREELKTTFYNEMALGAGPNFSAEERLLPIVQELELTYRNRSLLRLLLFVVYRDLAQVVDRSGEGWEDKVALYVETGLQSVGLSTSYLLSFAEHVNPDITHIVLIPDILFDYAGLMAEKEYFSGRLDLVNRWVHVILLVERIYRGGNLEMLKRRFLGFKEVPSLLSAFENTGE